LENKSQPTENVRLILKTESILTSFLVNYNGVEDTGIEDNLAFITSDLSFWTLDFNLFDMLSVPLCDDTMTADENNANDCPGDGSYSYSVVYKLPNSGSDSASWLASGFEGSGFIRMYAEADESMMIGECILNLQTFMTETEESGLLRTPSAAAATGIALAVLAVVAMTCLYCYCCCRRRPDTRKQPRGNPEDSLESMFQRMEDEKSHYTRSTAAQSQRSSKGGASVLSGMGTVPIM